MAIGRTHPARSVVTRPSAAAAAYRLSVSSARLRRQSLLRKMIWHATPVATAATPAAEVTAAVEPQLASVWGMTFAPTRIHIMHGTPASVAEIVPLQLEDLRPANLTKPALLEFLQSTLTTRAAVQKAVQCMVLSASAYLPSQLDTINGLASGIRVSTTLCISAASVHILFMPSLAGLTDTDFQQRLSGITRAVCGLLAPTFGSVQLLPAERMTAARAAETTLNRQLRLWHPPTWGETLQQELRARKARQHAIAVRSLMGPVSLAAARKLVSSQNMWMFELLLKPAEQAAAAAAAAADNSADSSRGSNLLSSLLGGGSSSRRRPSARAASPAGDAGNEAAGDAGSAEVGHAAKQTELVLVIACWPLDRETAMQTLQQPGVFTDVLLA